MNIVIDRVQFQKSLSFIRSVAGATGNIIVEGDADGNCHLRAVDLYAPLDLDLIVAGTVAEPGSVSAPLRNLPAMIKHMRDSVPVELSEESVLFGPADRRLTLHSAQVPEVPGLSDAYQHQIRIGASVFAHALDLVAHSAATGYDRPNLSAVSLDLEDDEAKLVSTDGFRLSIVELAADSSEFEGQLLIPDTAWRLLARMVKPMTKDRNASVFVRWNNNDAGTPQDMAIGWQPSKAAAFEVASVKSTIMDAHFPQWRRIAYGVRSEYAQSELDLREMEAAVQAAAALTADRNNMISLSGQSDGVRFSSEIEKRYPSDSESDNAAFAALVPAQPADGLSVSVNGTYLSKFLAAAGRQTERIRVSFHPEQDSKAHAPFFCLFGKACYLLMPMRPVR